MLNQEQITAMLQSIFTPEEIEAITESLKQGILDGWAEEGNDSPIVAALVKFEPDTPPQFDEE